MLGPKHDYKRDSTTLKVVCVGLGRTGSTSLALALTVLGYMVQHDDEQVGVAEEFYNQHTKIISEDELQQIMGIYGYNATFKTSYTWAVDRPETKGALIFPLSLARSLLLQYHIAHVCKMRDGRVFGSRVR